MNTTRTSACGFTELAVRYNPHTTVKTARRILRQWITINRLLQDELAATGYSPTLRILTPAQVAMIYRHLGEP